MATDDFEAAPGYRSVTWRGREYEFTAMQAAAIELLHSQRGRWLPEAYVLERIGSASSRLRDIFKGKKYRNGVHPA